MNMDNENQGVVPAVDAPQPVAQPAPVVNPTPAPEPYVGPAPVTTNDRTKDQFDKLLDSNAKLFQANELLRGEMSRRAQSNQQFAPIQQPAQTSSVQDFIEVDPVTGETIVNTDKLKSKLSEIDDAKAQASRAETTVQTYIQTNDQRDIERQNRETFVAYPELDPQNEKFSKDFHNRTRQLLQDAYTFPEDYGGRPLTFKEAADMVKTQTTTSAAPEVAPATPEVPVDDGGLKAQASASVSVQPEPVVTNESDEALHQRLSYATKRGDTEALAIRLNLSDHTRPASEEEA